MKRILTTIAVMLISVIFIAGCQNAATIQKGLSNDQLKQGALQAMGVNLSVNQLQIEATTNSIIIISQDGLWKTIFDRVNDKALVYGKLEARTLDFNAEWKAVANFGTLVPDDPTILEFAHPTIYTEVITRQYYAFPYMVFERPTLTPLAMVMQDPRSGQWTVILDDKGLPILGPKAELSGAPWDYIDKKTGKPATDWAALYMGFAPYGEMEIKETVPSEGEDTYIKLSGHPITVDFILDLVPQYRVTMTGEYMEVFDKDGKKIRSLIGIRSIGRDLVTQEEIFNELADPVDLGNQFMDWLNKYLEPTPSGGA